MHVIGLKGGHAGFFDPCDLNVGGGAHEIDVSRVRGLSVAGAFPCAWCTLRHLLIGRCVPGLRL